MKFRILIWVFVLIISITGLSLVLATNLVTENVKEVDIAWRSFQQDRSEKARLTSSLRTAVGYGGMIHHFKNYVLRQHISQMDKAQEHLGAANNIVKQFRTLGATEQEMIALDDIQQVLNKYSDALLSTNQLIAEHKTPVEIDGLVKVDDTYALRGLDILDADLELLNRQYGDAYIHTKTKDLTALKAIMGFGGMIHEFKNYVLRQDESRKEAVHNKILEAKKLIKQYKIHEVTLAETVALEDLEITLNAYEQGLANVATFIDKKLKPKAIDEKVKVDDSKAIRAFIVLEREIARKMYADSSKLSKQLNFSHELGERVTLAIILLMLFTIVFSVWSLYSKLIKPLIELNLNMEQLAKGNLDLVINGMDSNNEVGDMARNLLIFRENALLKQQADKLLSDNNTQLVAEVHTREQVQRELEKERESLEERIAVRTQDLIIAKENAISANKTKTQFLSRMSHELRTPMNAIVGFSDLLATDEEYPLSESQAENLEEISVASHKLLKLIDDILELSDIEMGTLNVDISEIHLYPVMTRNIEYLQTLALEKEIEVSSSGINENDVVILGNENRIDQILHTIMACAIKRTANKGCITLLWENGAPGYQRLKLVLPACILTAAEQSNLFDAFVDEEMLGAGADDLGTGMLVVKQLVELMQGRLGVDSSPEMGSSLWLEFKQLSN